MTAGTAPNFCPKCGATPPTGARYCSTCGLDFQAPAGTVGLQAGGKRSASPMVILGVFILAGLGLGLGAVFLSGHSGPPPSSSPGAGVVASPSAVASSPVNVGTALCQSYAALLTAEEDEAQVGQALMNNLSGGSTAVQTVKDAAASKAPEMASRVLTATGLLTGVIYPQDPDLLVALRSAEVGLGEIAIAYKNWVVSSDATFVGILDTAQTGSDAADAMTTATGEIDRLEAAGTLSCP